LEGGETNFERKGQGGGFFNLGVGGELFGGAIELGGEARAEISAYGPTRGGKGPS